jgi:multicomponent Na+:H+ antiporter subunit G
MTLPVWQQAIILILATIGTVFMLISGIGMIRLPDVLTRMHAAGKAATLGVSGLLLAAGITFALEGRLATMVALIVLFFVTAPIATTSMARAAYNNPESRKHFTLQPENDDLKDHQPDSPLA